MTDPWYESFFDERYLAFYPVLRKQPVAHDEARAAFDLLGLTAGQRVLDLGCGTGRHSIALAEMGLQVTGLDLSEALLAQARTTAATRHIEVRWLCRDMRDLEDLGPFDACVSLYTAFGFFGDAEDQEVLYQIAASLCPAGKLLLDVTNHLGYLCRFPREVWRETEEAVLRERNTYEPLSGVLVTERVCFAKDGGRFALPQSRVRAYMPHELQAMLGRAGFEIEQVRGGLDQGTFAWNSSPCQIYCCRKR
jgi:SAM-dependent methyltransferase